MACTITGTCIDCTARAKACPVDALTGERGEMHVIHGDVRVDCGLRG